MQAELISDSNAIFETQGIIVAAIQQGCRRYCTLYCCPAAALPNSPQTALVGHYHFGPKMLVPVQQYSPKERLQWAKERKVWHLI